MAAQKPLVSIITINYNQTAVTVDLLESIHYLTYPNVEVIVVDNASRESPVEALQKAYPDVRLIMSPKNLGFAGGNNLGIKAAKGEYLFFVNNDTVLTPTILEGLVEIFDTYPDAGAVSPKFHYYDAPGTIEFAGYEEVNIFSGRNAMVGCKKKDYGQYDKAGVTNYAHGGGMMVPAWVIREVGLMPEVYFLYYEEFDWCESIKRKGYQIYYQPKSLIYHKESMTVGKVSTLKTFYQNRNRILFMRRNVKGWPLVVFTTYYALCTVPKNTLKYIAKRESKHLRAFWQGLAWNLSNWDLSNLKH
ncbi:MAG TPA: glycosyltransferase family 2 protein [Dinghuibacter sp.]|uniref:glycosyltransferase family 2 protein n=1 Tax=Dinghuibacter sp. TaxID=2024697 RepID=UPI002CF7F07F|nr:glycosyltransferase family 2 protein [Dinghuibacter sp.]HTJ14479.1 glycosyltransferase family 2 protein [Dinghuibacter sp.]